MGLDLLQLLRNEPGLLLNKTSLGVQTQKLLFHLVVSLHKGPENILLGEIASFLAERSYLCADQVQLSCYAGHSVDASGLGLGFRLGS